MNDRDLLDEAMAELIKAREERDKLRTILRNVIDHLDHNRHGHAMNVLRAARKLLP